MNNSGAAAGSKWVLAGLGVLIALIGLGLAGGGGYLIALGGSWYFLLMGLAMLASGLMITRRKPLGAWLYGVALVLTAIWAVWDAGLEYWPLVSRVLTFAVIGLVVALVYPTCSALRARPAGVAPTAWLAFWAWASLRRWPTCSCRPTWSRPPLNLR